MTCLPTPKACFRGCAKRLALPGTRRCSAGRRAGATPTAPGRRTGMARWRRAPASARPKTARSIYPRTRGSSPNAAVLITNGSRRTASRPDGLFDLDAVPRPLPVDVDALIRPLVAGPALDGLDQAPGHRVDLHA